MAAALLGALPWLVGGCPAPAPGSPPAAPGPSPVAPAPGPTPGPTPVAPADGPPAAPESRSPGVAQEPPGHAPAPGAEAPASFGVGEVLRPAAEVALGLVGFGERAGRPTARIAVGFGHLAFQVECVEGERFVAGPTAFEVTRVSPGSDAVSLVVVGGGRLEGSIPDAADLVVPAPAGERLELDAMGLHRLPDGVVLAVGNVVVRDGHPTAWLAAYPAGYAADPMRDYDLWPAARPGAALGGKVAKLTVESATPPGAAGERGRLIVRRAP